MKLSHTYLFKCSLLSIKMCDLSKEEIREDSNIKIGKFSKEVLDVLDYIGYSKTIIEKRRAIFRDKDALMNSRTEDVMFITAGSKGEGLSSCFESDYDRLTVYLDIACIKEDNCYSRILDTTTVFHMLDNGCHPGHYMLKLFKRGSVVPKAVEASLVFYENNEILISSDVFTAELERTVAMDEVGGWDKGHRTGPAVPSARGIYCRDDVYAFRCLCEGQILAEWANRDREHGWPSSDLVRQVCDCEAQIVPVGCKESQNRTMEWRICFVLGELLLTDSFNAVQSSLYILLKQINNILLKPICRQISSYVMKNLVFWICEETPIYLFHDQNLFYLLKLALEKLRTAVNENHLSYFMSPARNLLSGIGSEQIKQHVVRKIEEIIAEGPQVIKRLPRLYSALTKFTPEQVKTQGQERDTFEYLELTRQHIVAVNWRPELKREEVDIKCWMDKNYRDVRFEMYDMVWPQWRQSLSSCRKSGLLEQTIESMPMNGLKKFPDQYRRFARSYLSIIWPHMQDEVHSVADVLDEDIVELLAILRGKIEKALS